MSEKYNSSFDILRFVFATMIVMQHTISMMYYNGYAMYGIIHMTQRLGVPFFFLLSSYFFGEKNLNKSVQNILLQLLKWIMLYLFWSLIHFIVNSYDWFLPGYFDYGMMRWYIVYVILRGKFGVLWFLYCMICGNFITILFRNVSKKTLILLIIMLSLFMACCDSLYGIVSIFAPAKYIIDLYYKYFITLRDGVAFGLVFGLLGLLLSKIDINTWKCKDYLLWISTWALYSLEGYYMFCVKSPKEYGFYLFSIPVCFFIVKFAVSHPCFFKRSVYLRIVSGNLYFIHMLIFFVWQRGFAIYYMKNGIVLHDIIGFLFTYIISLCISLLIAIFCEKPKIFKYIFG